MRTHNPTNQPLLFEEPYSSVAPERCALQHDWRLVSIFPKRKDREYEYQCNMCNVEHIFQSEELVRKPNPLCFEEKHYWVDACLDGCCPWMYCYCGAVKPIAEGYFVWHIKYSHNFDGTPVKGLTVIQ